MRELNPETDLPSAAIRQDEQRLRDRDTASTLPYLLSPTRPFTRRNRNV